VAIMHASPPDSYRRKPSRRRKQYSPKRFVAAAGAPPSAAASHAGDPHLPAASLGPALPSASGLLLGTRASTFIIFHLICNLVGFFHLIALQFFSLGCHSELRRV
jgi:hypothetical protein